MTRRLIHRKIILQIHIHAQVAARPRFGDDSMILRSIQGPEELPRALHLRLPGFGTAQWLRAINCCIAQHPSPLRLITVEPASRCETWKRDVNRSGGAAIKRRNVFSSRKQNSFPAVCV